MESEMFEDKLARVMKLVEQRNKINAELAELLGTGTPSKRGRPRKEQGNGSSTENAPTGHGAGAGLATGQSTGSGPEAG